MWPHFCSCYNQCIYFSLSQKVTSLMWPQFLGKKDGFIRGGLLFKALAPVHICNLNNINFSLPCLILVDILCPWRHPIPGSGPRWWLHWGNPECASTTERSWRTKLSGLGNTLERSCQVGSWHVVVYVVGVPSVNSSSSTGSSNSSSS